MDSLLSVKLSEPRPLDQPDWTPTKTDFEKVYTDLDFGLKKYGWPYLTPPAPPVLPFPPPPPGPFGRQQGHFWDISDLNVNYGHRDMGRKKKTRLHLGPRHLPISNSDVNLNVSTNIVWEGLGEKANDLKLVLLTRQCLSRECYHDVYQ